jgi:hypothetical protein
MKAIHPVLAVFVCTSLSGPLKADVIQLKTGASVQGTYAGGTATTVVFQTPQGLQSISTETIVSLTFSGATPATSPASDSPAAAPATTARSSTITVPAGTALLVRMVDPVSSKDPKGKRFTTTLETDLSVDGVVVARAGTKVYGRVEDSSQARRLVGQSKLDLRLSEIAIGPRLVPLVTGEYAEAGARSIRKTARGAAAGAAIGAIADGGDGAATGAAIGAVASGVRRGESVAIHPSTLLEFRLEQPLTVTPAG